MLQSILTKSCGLALVLLPYVKLECKVDGFHVQKKFNLTQYMGTWYELKWLPRKSTRRRVAYDDYVHTYTLHNGTVYVDIQNRVGSDCLRSKAKLLTTSTPGKLLYTSWNIPKARYITTDYWVISTDYTSFALTYGCVERDDSGKCIITDSWIWSRSKSISENRMMTIAIKVKLLCINYTNYVTTSQNIGCPFPATEKTTGSKNVNPEVYIVSSVTALVTLILVCFVIVFGRRRCRNQSDSQQPVHCQQHEFDIFMLERVSPIEPPKYEELEDLPNYSPPPYEDVTSYLSCQLQTALATENQQHLNCGLQTPNGNDNTHLNCGLTALASDNPQHLHCEVHTTIASVNLNCGLQTAIASGSQQHMHCEIQTAMDNDSQSVTTKNQSNLDYQFRETAV